MLCLQIILEAGADIDALGFNGVLTPVMTASFYGHAEVLRELIRQGADVGFIGGPRNRSALHWAAFEPDNTGVIELLINEELDINLEDSFGATPLSIAAWVGNVNNVRFLLDQVCSSLRF